MGELIFFHDDAGKISDTGIILGNRKEYNPENILSSTDYEHLISESLYSVYYNETGRTIEYPEYYLRMRSSTKQEYKKKYLRDVGEI